MDRNDFERLAKLRAKQARHVAALARIDAELCPLLTKVTHECAPGLGIDAPTVTAAVAPKTPPADD